METMAVLVFFGPIVLATSAVVIAVGGMAVRRGRGNRRAIVGPGIDKGEDGD